MAEDKKKKNVFQKIASALKDLADWAADKLADPAIAAQIMEDLGQNGSNPATPEPIDPALRQKIDVFLDKEAKDVDLKTVVSMAADIKALVDHLMPFVESVQGDGVTPWDVFGLVFRVWVADTLRVRNPSAYALSVLAGLVIDEEETLLQIDPSRVTKLLAGDATVDDSEAIVQRLSLLGGAALVAVDRLWSTVGDTIDPMYGWDPEPGTDGNAAVVASRALSVLFQGLDVVEPMLTVLGVPKVHGGPGVVLSVGAVLKVVTETDDKVYTFEVGADGAFSIFIPFSSEAAEDLQVLDGVGTPFLGLKLEPKDPTEPFLVVGASDATRLEVGAFGYGVEVGADHAGFRLLLRKGKLVITLSQGDGFLSNLPGGVVEVPFDLGLIADTKNGIRFDGGTGLKVDLPVSGSLFGVFKVLSLSLELKLADPPALEIRGGFGLALGPFQASVDQLGALLDLRAVTTGEGEITDMVKFAPPKGIGLALDLGVIKGGGYLFVDADKGEYAGALELKFATWSIKAIAVLTTKRPDGSEGWSLLLFVFGQFHWHIAFGIFWTGLGGMIGLHHRADLDALTAGMRTGALDDVLFPPNPVADAPRIIARYKQLFPIEPESLLVGPMFELSFSEPPIVYVRLGFILEVRNALGGSKPSELTKVILLGQLVVQLPPRDLGVPAILKLLVDVVGFYDTAERFLLIRARLRDSFLGIEGFAKLDLTGELVLAMRFGDDPTFVLSAGGFHPAFHDVPRGVPDKLDRLAASFGIGPIKMRAEQYFAVTSNSVQAGFKIELNADIDVAAIKGHLAFDALLFLEPRFYFLVTLDFQVSLRALGHNLMSVHVNMSLEGPGAWRAKGSFSFGFLWCDWDIGFDERWGTAPVVDSGTESAAAALLSGLRDPNQLLPGPPVGGNALVTLAPLGKGEPPLAHPLGVLTLSQKAVPLDVTIDRIGTRQLTEGTPKFHVDTVSVGGKPLEHVETVQEHFARGQFMELSEQEKLEGRSFERFTSGVRVGTTAYAVPSTSTDVTTSYEVKILDPEPRLNLHWVVRPRSRRTERLDSEIAFALAPFGAAGTSRRAREESLPADVGKVSVGAPPLAVVDPKTLAPKAATVTGPRSSQAVVREAADRVGGLVVEAFEVGLG